MSSSRRLGAEHPRRHRARVLRSWTMPAEIHASVVRLRPEAEAEYRRIHTDVWPSVLAQIARSHIRDYSIHLHDGLLFARFTYVGEDYAAYMATIAANPETQ